MIFGSLEIIHIKQYKSNRNKRDNEIILRELELIYRIYLIYILIYEIDKNVFK